MKPVTAFIASCLIAVCGGFDPQPQQSPAMLASMEAQAGGSFDRGLTVPFDNRSMAGNYLASLFAQQRHDWKKAEHYLSGIRATLPEDDLILKRSMILAMGSGNAQDAIDTAKKVLTIDQENSLSRLFVAIGEFKDKHYKQAEEHIAMIKDGSFSDFILPLMHSWAEAAQGKLETAGLNKNSLHMYHAILISDYLNQHDDLEALLEKALALKDIKSQDRQDIAAIYAHMGKKDKAIAICEGVLKENPENAQAAHMIADLKAGKKLTLFEPVRSAEDGMALALLDMARVLYQDYSDDSARVFAHLSLYLDPSSEDADLLLAAIATRNERSDEAISFYEKITPASVNYIEAHRRIAGLLDESGKTDDALMELQELADKHNDMEALVQIGDIYRRKKDFKQALVYYNDVEKRMGQIPDKFWHLYYVRGISYEQDGQWDKAEADLKAALSHQPDHPLILNYLGYAWADKGINLKQSLEYIKKAVALQPSDGYITDSLGWIYYRLGQYENAVPDLEKAVELLPYDPVINDHLGDAYWQVGRHMEAKFQWQRAKNYSEDADLIKAIEIKLANGPQHIEVVKEASSQITGDLIKTP